MFSLMQKYGQIIIDKNSCVFRLLTTQGFRRFDGFSETAPIAPLSVFYSQGAGNEKRSIGGRGASFVRGCFELEGSSNRDRKRHQVQGRQNEFDSLDLERGWRDKA